MDTVAKVIFNLPKGSRSGLDHYVASLKNVFGDNLTSVILHGSAARDEHIAGVSAYFLSYSSAIFWRLDGTRQSDQEAISD